ncbi:MAG: hypothetical protein DMF04_10540 [Verrucomicrobia bacterium]|nr:MAG: hypothetical protein DMF04_10540 [Verrucomicrobiota bacterium]
MLGLPLTRASVEPDRKDLLTTFFCGCAERRPGTVDASTIVRVNVCFDRGWAFDNGGALPQNFAMSFITFEGSEVCGKSTQVKPLAAFFEACHLDIRVIGNLNGFAMSNCFPDLTFVVDIDRATAQWRLRHRETIRDHMEEESDECYERVICAYRDLASNEAQRMVLVDARPSADMGETELWNLLVRRFPELEKNQTSTARLQSS